MKFKWKYVIVIVCLSLISISILEVGSFIYDKHGSLHHGIVSQAICNGFNSHVVIRYNDTSQAYIVDYSTCLIFLDYIGRGIIVIDNLWADTWIWYKLDDVKQ